jgi:integrase
MSFTANGKQYQKSTGTDDKKLAQKIFSKIQTQLVEQKYFDLDKAREYSFEDMMEKYFNEHAPIHKEASSVQRDKDSYTHLKQVFSGFTLDKITPALVIDYRNRRLSEKAAHSTILNELGLLRNAFNISIRHWGWCKENPVSQVKLGLKPRHVDRWLTYGEEQRLLAASKGHLNDQLTDIITFGLNTGMRKSEILSLKIQEIDFARKVCTVMKSKNKEKRGIPLNASAMEILIRRSTIIAISGFVFATSNGTKIMTRNLNRAFTKAVKKADIKDFRFHDLRHTFATRLCQSGIDLYVISRLLGHKSIQMTTRYSHHFPESLRSGVEVLNHLSENKGASGTLGH